MVSYIIYPVKIGCFHLLYKRARKNELKEFTGISSPYEVPLSPEIRLCTDQETVEEEIQKILST